MYHPKVETLKKKKNKKQKTEIHQSKIELQERINNRERENNHFFGREYETNNKII